MTTGVVLLPNPHADNAVDDVIDQARGACAAGVRQVWFAQRFDLDAIALAGVVGAAVPGLGVGKSVVPLNPRHPLIVAGLAQTAQARQPRQLQPRPRARRARTRTRGFRSGVAQHDHPAA